MIKFENKMLDIIEAFNSAPKKWKKAIKETIEENGLNSLVKLEGN